MKSKINWGQIVPGIILGLILGAGSTLFIQEGRIAKLEAQIDEFKNRPKENIVSNTAPVAKAIEQTPAPTPLTPGSESEHNQLTNAAWRAFESKDYETSIAKVTECIDKYEIQALNEQKDFSGKKLPPPLLGRPNNESKKEEIFSHGVLNDVAACYFIKGQALEKLERIDEARKAYEKARKFPDARAWNVAEGVFWSPAIGASNNLSRLNKSS